MSQESTDGSRAEQWDNWWPPILSGVLIGACQVPCVLWIGDTLGASTGYMSATSQWLYLSSTAQQKFSRWDQFRTASTYWWQIVYALGAIGGSLLSTKPGDTFGTARGVPAVDAFVGGFLALLGARIASGCTTGHGLSRMPLLSVQYMVAVPFMFAAGMATAFAYKAASETFLVE